MKFVKWFLIVLCVLVVLLFAIAFFLPEDYHIERSVEIQAPAVLVYSQVVDLEVWQEWNPWKDADAQMKIHYGDIRVGQGASYSWVSEVTGNGRMTLIETEAPGHARFKLEFEGYEDMPTYASFFLTAPDALGPTTVTWTFEGSVGDRLLARYMVPLMDKMVGASYDKGLAELKQRCEGMATPATPVPASPEG